MTDDEFRNACEDLYGRVGWRRRMALDLNTRPETVGRWGSGIARPRVVELYVELALAANSKG